MSKSPATRSRAARGTSRFPSLKTRVPPPVGRGRVLHINFFSANSLVSTSNIRRIPSTRYLVSGTTGMTIDRDPRHVSGHVDVRARGIDRAREKQIHVPIFPRGNLAHIADTR